MNPQTSVPPALHESAFTQYRRFTDDPVGSWRDANDTVNQIGGWQAYTREANEAVSPPPPRERAPTIDKKPGVPPKATPKPKDPHDAHK